MWKTRDGDVEESLKEMRGYKEEGFRERRSSRSLKMMLLTKVDVDVC